MAEQWWCSPHLCMKWSKREAAPPYQFLMTLAKGHKPHGNYKNSTLTCTKSWRKTPSNLFQPPPINSHCSLELTLLSLQTSSTFVEWFVFLCAGSKILTSPSVWSDTIVVALELLFGVLDWILWASKREREREFYRSSDILFDHTISISSVLDEPSLLFSWFRLKNPLYTPSVTTLSIWMVTLPRVVCKNRKRLNGIISK